ncbi:hypothetical protein OIP13_10930 [Citrobacter freundii]|nr:hypothetical protein [Citrobacter freundii]
MARYPINIAIRRITGTARRPETDADPTPMKQQITLGDVADIKVVSGPTMLKTENARPASWIYIDGARQGYGVGG